MQTFLREYHSHLHKKKGGLVAELWNMAGGIGSLSDINFLLPSADVHTVLNKGRLHVLHTLP